MQGHEVVPGQFGLDANGDDVAATRTYLGQVSSQAVLIGHSYGGANIAAGADDRVAGVAYIATLGSDAGETSESLKEKFPKAALRQTRGHRRTHLDCGVPRRVCD